MDLPNQDQFRVATRKDGWTPALKARFLALLAENGNVRLAARRCGLSAQSAYVQRRRDAIFARGWAGALWLARDHAEQVLADRAIEGVEEDIWYRGELVGSRRRYDSRLLLAHLARLDKQALDQGTSADADRFDELVALVAGAELPEALAADADVLPVERRRCARDAAALARSAAIETMDEDSEDLSIEEREAQVEAAATAAFQATDRAWQTWHDRVCAAIDAVAPAGPMDSVNLSASDETPART